MRDRRIPCVRGNHDRWALGEGSAADPDALDEAGMGDATGWVLSQQALTYLEALPATLKFAIDGVRFLVCHARPGSDMLGIHPDDPSSTVLEGWAADSEVDVIVVGHTHTPLVRSMDSGKFVINPGTLFREPKDAIEPAMVFDQASGKFVRQEPVIGTFGVFDTATREFTLMRVGQAARHQEALCADPAKAVRRSSRCSKRG